MSSDHNPDPGQVILIDKPYDWTSFDVVKKIRGVLKVKKVGHAGTLDPLATGLLIVCAGAKTKQINHFQDLDKEYQGILMLGKSTPSIDLETPIVETHEVDTISEQQIIASAQTFVGALKQIPPEHSAVRVGGERVYRKARAGTPVNLPPRLVDVSLFEITRIHMPEVEFRIQCSKGTYIRSLVRDLGQDLGVGALLLSLRRTRIGEFGVDQAMTLNQFLRLNGQEDIQNDEAPRFLRTKPQS